MSAGTRYLIVDGHSVIFSWPKLRALHHRRSSLARDALVTQLRHYQDWTGTRVVIVFDGKGETTNSTADPHDIQIFYSRRGQTADAIIERLASRYAKRFPITVVTGDYLEQQTAAACGAECISPEIFQPLVEEAVGRNR